MRVSLVVSLFLTLAPFFVSPASAQTAQRSWRSPTEKAFDRETLRQKVNENVVMLLAGQLGEPYIQLAQDIAVAVDDADVQVVDQQGDAGSGAAGAQADVVQPAVVAQGDAAAVVDAVVPDAPVRVEVGAGGGGLGAGGVGLPGCLAGQCPVGSDLVVVAAEPGELAGQAGDGLGR